MNAVLPQHEAVPEGANRKCLEGMDSFHISAAKTDLAAIDEVDATRTFLVQLSDFMWNETPTFEDRMTTARTVRVFPGEDVLHQAVLLP
jgi:hypothetical protein